MRTELAIRCCPIGHAVLWTPGEDRPRFIPDPHPHHRHKTTDRGEDDRPIPYRPASLEEDELRADYDGARAAGEVEL